MLQCFRYDYRSVVRYCVRHAEMDGHIVMSDGFAQRYSMPTFWDIGSKAGTAELLFYGFCYRSLSVAVGRWNHDTYANNRSRYCSQTSGDRHALDITIMALWDCARFRRR